MTGFPQLIVTGGPVYTSVAGAEWVDAFAVGDGRVAAVGSAAEIMALAGPETEVLDTEGRLVLPGLSDGHIHLFLGGSQAAWELPLLPADSKEEIFAKVRAWAEQLEPEAWIVGGIVGSTVMDAVMNTDALAALDAASLGHPVLLRDDSMHNRWVNSRALELMGVSADSQDPAGGQYVRDADGRLTGVLHEIASSVAEEAFTRSITDPDARNRVSMKKAIEVVNSYGITSVQDAATMGPHFSALAELEQDSEISAWVVTSTPSRQFLEVGVTGAELYDLAKEYRSEHIRPDFVKFVLDGVPMTRTTAMIHPYIAHGHDDEGFLGVPYWTLDELVAELKVCYERELGGKLHATGDGSVRLVLDAVEIVRKRHGAGPVFQIAHVEFIDPADLPRFAELGVVADASPYIWYPGIITESIAQQIPAETLSRTFPLRDFIGSGAVVAAGSDWPCVLPTPDPWIGIETMVTRANIDPSVPGELNGSQKLTVAEAVAALTRNPADAMGLGDVTGSIKPGLSADFIVLDQNIFEVEPNRIHDTKVDLTYFEGAKRFERAASLLA